MFEKYVCPKCGGKLKKARMVCFPSVLYVCRPCKEVYWNTELMVTDKDIREIERLGRLSDYDTDCKCRRCGIKQDKDP